MGVKKLLYTGTIDSYFTAKPNDVIRDETPLDPLIETRNLYARAKAISESILLEMHRNKGLPLAIFRPGVVIGSGGSPFHWGIGMWNGMSVCRVWGKGDTKLPLVLVEDVADALVTAGNNEAAIGKIFNLVGDPLLTAREYLEALQGASGVKCDIRYTSAWKFLRGDLLKYVVKVAVQHPERKVPSLRDWDTRAHRARFECTNAKTILGWKPVHDKQRLIEEGITIPTREWLA
jgi:nucleoside-diphosphate-sugar epimerase